MLKLGGKSNIATYRPGKCEDDEIRKTLIIAELLHAQDDGRQTKWPIKVSFLLYIFAFLYY